MLTRQPQGSLPIQNESRVDAWEREGNKRRGCNVELRVSSCQTAAYQYSAPRQEREREREMDGAQERGRLKRQMKGRHIEGREMWQWEALVTERGTKGWMNERDAESRREGGWGEQCLNIELNTDRYEKRKEATVCYIWERRERQEPNNSSFLVIGGKEKDRKAAVHPGSSEAFNWRWGEAG